MPVPDTVTSENPLLSRALHPPFDRMTAASVEAGVRQAVDRAETELERLVGYRGRRTFENTLMALDALAERPARAFGFARHLTQVRSSPDLRQAYNEVLPIYSAFVADIPFHAGLWDALRAYAATDEARGLDGLRRRHLEKTLAEFRRAGADLPPKEQARVKALHVELSRLSTRFSENVLDATNAFEMILTDDADLDGLPAGVLRRARADAEARGVEGYRFTLQAPSYRPFMKFAASRRRRRELYRAFTSRAAAGSYDNRPVLTAILRLRRELAEALGYANYADLLLGDRMLKSGSAAQAFERELARRTVPFHRTESGALERFARERLGIERLQPWDLEYVAQALRRSRFQFDEEELRPYFPLDRVLAGVFSVAERLFGVGVERLEDVPVWHPDVGVYRMTDRDGVHVGDFYVDLYPRASKRDGAWMNPMVTGGPEPGSGFSPHAGVVAANLTPPADGAASLLTHDEVLTLFHEFGHLLHHLLGRVEVPARGSLANVAWDFVELPSQLMENWAWERESLDLFARHADTDALLPDELYQRLTASRTFLAAGAQMRQLSLGTVDLALHIDYDPWLGGDPIAFGQHVMEPFALRPDFAHNQFLASFSHIFASGYAAGYYSYKWSEALDADVFSRFQRDGIFNAETGRAFVEAVLSRGDADDPERLFRRFMGRDVDLDALVRRNLGAEAGLRSGDP